MTRPVSTNYTTLANALATHFGERLKTIVLFGSRSRGEARADSDHDIFVVIEGLPLDPLERQREVMMPLIMELDRLPERLSVIAKTPQELQENLAPLLVDVCVDGTALYGEPYFQAIQSQVLQLLREAGLQRRYIAGTWMWMFPTLPKHDWALTWKGYRERV